MLFSQNIRRNPIMILSSLLMACVLVACRGGDDTTQSAIGIGGAAKVFQPTDEWQTVEPNQAIPPGLHVKMDLSTGEKMARNLPESERTGRSFPETTNHAILPSLPNPSQIKSPSEFLSQTLSPIGQQPNVPPLLSAILAPLTDPNTCAASSDALLELADFVDDLDNSERFVKSGGLASLYVAAHPTFPCPSRNHANAWLVLGSMLQNNPKVQDKVLNDGILSLSLPTMNLSLSAASTDELKVLAKQWYAMAALLRNFDKGQKVFEHLHGWDLVADTLRAFMERSDSDGVGPIIRKVASLVYDIAEERGVQVLTQMVDQSAPRLCDALVGLIEKTADTDVFAQVSDCLVSMIPTCQPHISRDSVRISLNKRYPSIPTIDGSGKQMQEDETDYGTEAAVRLMKALQES